VESLHEKIIQPPLVPMRIGLLRAMAPDVKILAGGRATMPPHPLASMLGTGAVARCGSETVGVARAWK